MKVRLMRLLAMMTVAAALALPLSAVAQERTAGQANDAQVNWSALSSQINLVSNQNKVLAAMLDKYNTCGAKTMLYVASSTSADNPDGCVSAGGSFPTDYCYAMVAERWATPHCEKDYYVKGQIKATDNDWDGYSAVCCYMKSGKDARVEANKAGFVTSVNALAKRHSTVQVVPSSIGLTYQQIVTACLASPGTYGHNEVTCPVLDTLH